MQSQSHSTKATTDTAVGTLGAMNTSDTSTIQGKKPKNLFKRVFGDKRVNLIMLLVALIVLLIGSGAYYFTSRFIADPIGVRITNVTSNSATVTWVTKNPQKAVGLAVPEAEGLKELIVRNIDGSIKGYDDRDYTKAELDLAKANAEIASDGEISGKQIEQDVEVTELGAYYTHHVTFRNLDPESSYTIYVGDGLTYQRVIDGASEVFSTLSFPEDLYTPDPIYGTIEIPGEIKSLPDPVSDGIFYYYISDNSGNRKSTVLSSPLGENGSWYLDLTTLRTPDGEYLTEKYSEDDLLSFMRIGEIRDANGNLYRKEIPSYKDSPADDIMLQPSLLVDESSEQSMIKDFSSKIAFQSLAQTSPSTCEDVYYEQGALGGNSNCTSLCHRFSSRDASGRCGPEWGPGSFCVPDPTDPDCTPCAGVMCVEGEYCAGGGNEQCCQGTCRSVGQETGGGGTNTGGGGTNTGGGGTNTGGGGTNTGGGGTIPSASCGENTCGPNEFRCWADPTAAGCEWRKCVGGGWVPANPMCVGDNPGDTNSQVKNSGDACTPGSFLPSEGGCDGYGPLDCTTCPSDPGKAFCVRGGTTPTEAQCNKEDLIIPPIEVPIQRTSTSGCPTYRGISPYTTPDSDSDICTTERLIRTDGTCYVACQLDCTDPTPDAYCFEGMKCKCTPAAPPPLSIGDICDKDNNKNCGSDAVCTRVGSNTSKCLGWYGSTCSTHSQCLSNNCDNKKCAASELDVFVVPNSQVPNVPAGGSVQTPPSSGGSCTVKNDISECDYTRNNVTSKGRCLCTDIGVGINLQWKLIIEDEDVDCPEGAKSDCVCANYEVSKFLPPRPFTMAKEGDECGGNFSVKGRKLITPGEDCPADTESSGCLCDGQKVGAGQRCPVDCNSNTVGLKCEVEGEICTKFYRISRIAGLSGQSSCLSDPGDYSSPPDDLDENNCNVKEVYECFNPDSISPGEAKGPLPFPSDQPISDVSLMSLALPVDAQGDSIVIAPDQGVYAMEDLGLYCVDLDDGKYCFEIASEGNYELYIDRNANGEMDDEDLRLGNESVQVRLEEEYSVNYQRIYPGLNLVQFPYIGRDYGSALELLEFIHENYQNGLISIAGYESGSWSIVGVREDGKYYGSKDFQIIPGRGYLLKATSEFFLELRGQRVIDPVPISFSPGWNLIGVTGASTQYTAETLLDSLNLNSIQSDNVSRWIADKGRYDGLQKEQDENGLAQVYGFDFPIIASSGYFVRVLQGQGTWTPE
ncbi:hypothetical protein KC685_03170 [Candidatus Dojkabacteria bacterium]|uniref:Purple acid phosphatase N-terminal domain-containing protein n=1 Tax=Candidatus Dojkabacteria bacterium TaxID=2099670 RepID=A0A955KXB3_9BACT|nr:hypothetical protein [Candidatus Dojkabacteria bacterium]